MKKFTVVLEINEVEASSEMEAAAIIREWLSDLANWVYVVQDEETKVISLVDLEDETIDELSDYKPLIK